MQNKLIWAVLNRLALNLDRVGRHRMTLFLYISMPWLDYNKIRRFCSTFWSPTTARLIYFHWSGLAAEWLNQSSIFVYLICGINNFQFQQYSRLMPFLTISSAQTVNSTVIVYSVVANKGNHFTDHDGRRYSLTFFKYRWLDGLMRAPSRPLDHISLRYLIFSDIESFCLQFTIPIMPSVRHE